MFTKFVNKLPLFLRSHEKPDPCNFAGKIDMPSKPTESHHFMKKKKKKLSHNVKRVPKWNTTRRD